jgi:TonB family protein
MPFVEQSSHLQVSSVPPQFSENKQRRRMLVALVLLVCALALVLYRDRDILFPPTPDEDSDVQTQTVPQTSAVSQPATTTIVRQPVSSHGKAKQHAIAPPVADASANNAPVVMTRAVLPPLEIEVVAGDSHQTVQATNPSIKVDLQPRSSGSAHSASAPPVGAAEDASHGTVNASARVRLSPGTALVVSRPVQPDYPLLARQMKVQGSVILQAVIGKEGTIQELQVLSGPAILSVAAREAVKQWHFKPYLQSGLPVETEAKITVNFTISTN